MIIPLPRYFFIMTWFLIGPAAPQPAMIAFLACVLILAIALRRSVRYGTIALVSILGIMLLDGLQIVIMGLHLELTELNLFHEEV